MRTSLTAALLVALTTGAAAQTRNTDPDSARIVTSDIDNFWQAYDRLEPNSTREDSVRVFSEIYLQPASPGLAEFVRLRIESADKLIDALNTLPRYYAAIRPNTLSLHESASIIRAGLRRFDVLYADAVFPDIYFLVGRFTSMGTLSDVGLLIGAEMVTADASTPAEELPGWAGAVTLSAEVVPCIVIHELVHYQQDSARDPSLLAQALNEGVADFLAGQAVGCHATGEAVYAYGDKHEPELWSEFQEGMHGTDYGRWLYNGATSTDRPANLGYWMGYRIAEAYYEQAEDKRRAIYDLLHISDYNALLVASGFAERMDR